LLGQLFKHGGILNTGAGGSNRKWA
jgi:hypothetical protein